MSVGRKLLTGKMFMHVSDIRMGCAVMSLVEIFVTDLCMFYSSLNIKTEVLGSK